MQAATTRDAFVSAVQRLLVPFIERLWDKTDASALNEHFDDDFLLSFGRLERELLGVVLTSASERLGPGLCSCGSPRRLVQRRPMVIHTVLPGRDIDTRVAYCECTNCDQRCIPLLSRLNIDGEGFSLELRELGLLASVIEPYERARTILLERFARVHVSTQKLETLVGQNGQQAREFLARAANDIPPEECLPDTTPVYVGVDGGMARVDGAWQECKLACLFKEEERAEISKERHVLLEKDVVGIRGTPDELAPLLGPRLREMAGLERVVIWLGDGAHWIWKLAKKLAPDAIEILDWYHADEHISLVARVLYEEDEMQRERWRAIQLDRLEHDEVERVEEGLRELQQEERTEEQKSEIRKLMGYLEENRERMRYGTYRKNGWLIGSGMVESCVNHVLQQRMKRAGMRWKAEGADAMLALRCIYCSPGRWDQFRSVRQAA